MQDSGTSQQQADTLHGTGTAIAGGGSLIKGIGAYEAGKFNAKVARFNKAEMLSDSVAQQQQIRDMARQTMGEQIASQGASGMDLGTGSALDVLHESAVNAQLDAMALRRKSTLKGIDYDNQAWSAKATGTAGFVSGLTEAASSAFSAGADYAAAGA